MIRSRSVTTFRTVDASFVDLYFPKPNSMVLRPVRRVVAYLANNLVAEVDYPNGLVQVPILPYITITLRDDQDRELVKDAPLWMFGEARTFADPGLALPKRLMHRAHELGDLMLAPDRCSINYTRSVLPGAGKNICALEFVYA